MARHIPFVRLLALATRQLLRDLRAGELRVLFGAVLIAVAASTAIGYFGARLNGAMLLRASEFLGADLVLSGSAPASAEQLAPGHALGLGHARVVEFSSVIATDLGIQLASVKAADDAYPLRGELRSAAEPYGVESAGAGPRPGEAWAEARLFAALELAVGDSIDVGDHLEPLVIPELPAAAPAGGPANFADRALVIFGRDRRLVFGDGDLFSIDRGTNHGITAGTRLAIYRDRQNGLPLVEVGEAVILETAADTSRAVLVRVSDLVQAGDIAVVRAAP